jgi:hypothetical protein
MPRTTYLQIWMGGLGGGASNSVMGFALSDDFLDGRWYVVGREHPHIPPATYHLPFYCIRCGGILKSSLSRGKR